MRRYLSTENVYLATAIYLVVIPLLAFLLTNPPNPTLLTPVFYGIVFLVSFNIWRDNYRWSKWLILFLYLSLLVGLFGPTRWALLFQQWLVFVLLILTYLVVIGNVWLHSDIVRNRILQKQNKVKDEEG